MDIVDNDNFLIKLQQEFPNKSIRFYKTDVRNRENIHNSFRNFINEFKQVDIVISNAGICDENKPEKCVQINLLGVIHTTYEAIDWMSVNKNGKGGIIVNVSSTTGLNSFRGMYPVYGSTKHAVVGFTKSMALMYKNKIIEDVRLFDIILILE